MNIVVPPNVPPGFTLFYTTREFREESLAGLLPVPLVMCNQVHGATVARWDERDKHNSCDALYSDQKHTALGIKVADCLPVTMIDPVHSVIANIHSGWRGAAQNITAKTIDTLERETAFDAAQSLAWLGPSIRVCCFEVGEEVASQFGVGQALSLSPRQAESSSPRQAESLPYTKPHLDIPAFTRDVLRKRGFADHAITDTQLCTRCEGSIFHSYRRGANGGRNLAIVAQ
ncbi:MAG TPA: polyphenol oxidase family protein [Thermoanaerobaculia bacterium]|nr:polyphenol oxidase family protein [Thermoanaerobaculia bacterium]